MGIRTGPAAGAVSSGNRAVAATATNSTAVRLGRIGYVTRGAVYLIVGWLALRAAVGIDTAAADKQGALEVVGQQPGGTVLLGLAGAGAAAVAVWGPVRAAVSPGSLG